jgi:hypothetical protein
LEEPECNVRSVAFFLDAENRPAQLFFFLFELLFFFLTFDFSCWNSEKIPVLFFWDGRGET